jgi:hypothetical protein
MTPELTGIRFTNELRGDPFLTNLVAHNGSGVAVGDVDADGKVDLYFCGLQGPNRLFRNLGNWRFEERDPGPAACADQFSTGAVFADVDGDGDPDLLVNGVAAGTRLFLNDGRGRWTEVADAGLSRTASATSLALADIDADGDLDLYCAHYIDVMHLADPTFSFALARRDDRWEVTKVNGESARLPRWKDRFVALPNGRVRELPEVDGLYRNDGHGRFTAIQNEPGMFQDEHGKPIPPFRDWGLAVMFRDLNGDGAPDLLVCNDNASPDRVWINAGRGAFRLIDPLKFRHMSRSSMGIDIADVNRDGLDDILVLDMLAREHGKRMTQLVRDLPDPRAAESIGEQPRYNRNTLFLGRPDGSFSEVALLAGVAATDWSFCPVFLDVDLDGYEDLLISNGFSVDVMDQDSHDFIRLRQRQLTQPQLKRSAQFHPAWPTVPAAFRNRGDGTFIPADRDWGFAQPGIAHGMAVGDLDGDGDLDVIVNHLNAAAGVYRNDASVARVLVRLKGTAPNTQGIGARLRLTGGPVVQTQEMICGGRYLSGDQAVRVFAANQNPEKPLQLEVKWPDGRLSVMEARPNQVCVADQAAARQPAREPSSAREEPFFADVSALVNHSHIEDAFDDWGAQALLPRRLSRLGPGMAWFDFDNDGWEDLIVTAGAGGKTAVLMNDQGNQFRPLQSPPSLPADQGAVVGWSDGLGNRRLLVAASNLGQIPERESEIVAYSPGEIASPEHWRAGSASPGPMALADIDGDGDLDLFAGGRFRAQRYPEPVSSAIWFNDRGRMTIDVGASRPFQALGLVSGAAFGDLDGDGDPDLALALEWGAIRLFRNEKGHFEEMTAAWGMADAKGWWTSVAMGDFDGDGRLDLAAGNWGRNSFHALYQPGPLRAYYGDWDDNGAVEIVEAWRHGADWRPIRHRPWLQTGLPDLQLRFPTHKAYGQATLREVLGSRYQDARYVEAAQFESAVFLHRGARFQRVILPAEAQRTPAFSVNIGDFDGDGLEDLFLSQNFFGAASDLSRDDDGRGLWLRGKGDGTFSCVDANISGIMVLGEQRGAALADFNHDGRVDLAVSQNNAATKLYVNRRGRPGLRVSLAGPAANPDAIGARMRLVYADGRKGPCRLVHAGSGYWSQDAACQVLGLASVPTAVWIRWPDGKERTVPVRPESPSVRIFYKDE